MGNMRASILILTLWVLCALAVFVSATALAVNQRVLVAKRIQDNENLHAIAEAGIKHALLQLKLDHGNKTAAALAVSCRDNPAMFKDVNFGQGSFNIMYTGPAGAQYYGMRDAERWININTATPAVLKRLFENKAGLNSAAAEKAAFAIIDYRDQDTVTKDGSGEEAYYKTYGHCQLKNANFEILDELLLVPGITSGIFDLIKPYITVYGRGAVNINTASQEVLELMGLKKNLVEKVIEFRAGLDGRVQSNDDINIEGNFEFFDALTKKVLLSAEDKRTLEAFLSTGEVMTSSSMVIIDCYSSLVNKNKRAIIECVCELNGKIVYWRESLFSQAYQ